MNLRTLVRTFALLLPCFVSGALAAQDPEAPEPLRYAQIATDQARIRNLADDRGNELARPAPGDLVGVFRELKDWLEVEVPGGYAVWVHGRYLRPVEGQEGIYEVTRNAVNMRPLPNSSVTSFPLPQRLHAGDRVRFIEFLDPTAEIEETWVRLWSPPGVRAWVHRSDVKPLDAGESGSQLWEETLRTLAGTEPPPVDRTEAPRPAKVEEEKQVSELAEASAKAVESEARNALDEARALLAREKDKPTPDFAPVRAALDDVLLLSPNGSVAVEARHELRLLEFHQEAAALRAELEIARQQRADELMGRQEEVWRESKSKDPLRDAFLVRGVLMRRPDSYGIPHYFIRFGREDQGEIVCTSGRYDLEVFAGYEVGIQGAPFGAIEDEGQPTVFEVTRVEVIARR